MGAASQSSTLIRRTHIIPKYTRSDGGPTARINPTDRRCTRRSVCGETIRLRARSDFVGALSGAFSLSVAIRTPGYPGWAKLMSRGRWKEKEAQTHLA